MPPEAGWRCLMAEAAREGRARAVKPGLHVDRRLAPAPPPWRASKAVVLECRLPLSLPLPFPSPLPLPSPSLAPAPPPPSPPLPLPSPPLPAPAPRRPGR